MLAAALFANAPNTVTAPACMTDSEFKDVALFILPGVVDGAVSRCEASLPRDAYLLNGGRRLGERLAGESDTHRPGAVAAIAKFGTGKIPEGVSNETFTSLVRDMAKTQLFKKIGADDCSRINEVAELLAPLPPENLIGVVALLARMGMAKDKTAPFRFCPVVPR
jgi:hypothetical protein